MKRQFENVSVKDFKLDNHPALNPKNRWVKLADTIDWDDMEEQNKKFKPKNNYTVYPFRCMLAAVLLQDITDSNADELVSAVRENPYFQYFLGCKEYTHSEVFSKTALTKFRRLISPEITGPLETVNISTPMEERKGSKNDMSLMQGKVDDLIRKNKYLQSEINDLKEKIKT